MVLPVLCGALTRWAGRGRAEADTPPERGPLIVTSLMEKKRTAALWLAQRPSTHNRVSRGPLERVTTRQLANGTVASPAGRDCVADHTCDDMWLIPSSGQRFRGRHLA
jgi:hypothetical protein